VAPCADEEDGLHAGEMVLRGLRADLDGSISR
jgi:hypothetical protein